MVLTILELSLAIFLAPFVGWVFLMLLATPFVALEVATKSLTKGRTRPLAAPNSPIKPLSEAEMQRRNEMESIINYQVMQNRRAQ